MKEALGVGRRMGAGRVILTHFSQRYPHMPAALTGGLGTNVCLAFDFMRYDGLVFGVEYPALVIHFCYSFGSFQGC